MDKLASDLEKQKRMIVDWLSHHPQSASSGSAFGDSAALKGASDLADILSTPLLLAERRSNPSSTTFVDAALNFMRDARLAYADDLNKHGDHAGALKVLLKDERDNEDVVTFDSNSGQENSAHNLFEEQMNQALSNNADSLENQVQKKLNQSNPDLNAAEKMAQQALSIAREPAQILEAEKAQSQARLRILGDRSDDPVKQKEIELLTKELYVIDNNPKFKSVQNTSDEAKWQVGYIEFLQGKSGQAHKILSEIPKNSIVATHPEFHLKQLLHQTTPIGEAENWLYTNRHELIQFGIVTGTMLVGGAAIVLSGGTAALFAPVLVPSLLGAASAAITYTGLAWADGDVTNTEQAVGAAMTGASLTLFKPIAIPYTSIALPAAGIFGTINVAGSAVGEKSQLQQDMESFPPPSSLP